MPCLFLPEKDLERPDKIRKVPLQRSEELPVCGFDDREGTVEALDARFRQHRTPDAFVGGPSAFDQPLFLEGPQNLGDGIDVQFHVAGHVGLADRGSVPPELGDRRQRDELGMGQVEGGKGLLDHAAPSGTDLP